MDSKLLKQFAAEADLIVRLRGVSAHELIRRVIEFLDMEFHGVVPLPLDDVQDSSPQGED